MAIIESDIQYNWVRKRVSKLKEKVDENTPTNNPYRIELELLSKLEQEYSEEHPIILGKEEKTIIPSVERTSINIYEGLPIMLEAVKGTALCEEIGKVAEWLNSRLKRRKNGPYSIRKFSEIDVQLVNQAVWSLGKKLYETNIDYSDDRQVVIDQIKEKYSAVFQNYIAEKKLGWSDKKFKHRMVNSAAKGSYLSFTETEVQQIVLGVREIASWMLSIEFVP